MSHFWGRLMRLAPLFWYRLACVLLAGAMVLLAWLPPSSSSSFYARLQGMAHDMLLPGGRAGQGPRVVVVDIDDASLAALGRWPWPRQTTADLIARVLEGGAVVVGVDVLFPEPSAAAADAALTAQLSRPEVVSAVAFGFAAHDPGAAVLPGRMRPPMSSAGRPLVVWPSAERQVAIASTLLPASLGHITPQYDPDHVIRRLYPVICHGDCYAMLAMAMLESWSGLPWQVETGPWLWSPRRVCVGAFCLRLNSDGSVSVPYQQEGRTATVSAISVWQGEANDLLRNAMVLIGTSAVGLGDLVATPLSATMPGVQIHGLLLTGALDGVLWSQLPGAALWESAAILLVLTMALLCPGRARGWQYATMLVGALVLLVGGWLPYLGYWFDPVPVWGAVGGGGVLLALWQAGRLLRQRRHIYRAFSAYVPQEVIRTLVQQQIRPEQLDGKRLEITVMFADIRGFTRLSERLEPEQLVELTNLVFTALNEEVHRHNGTLDKFMGDAMMAFWGAPLPVPDHDQQAVRCAVAIQRRLQALKGELARRGFPEIEMTIALESGPAAVGNFGSRQRRAYTVMGKTVNLAAHLQPACSSLGVNILCGPVLCERWPEGVERLGEVAIRGIDGLKEVGVPRLG